MCIRNITLYRFYLLGLDNHLCKRSAMWIYWVFKRNYAVTFTFYLRYRLMIFYMTSYFQIERYIYTKLIIPNISSITAYRKKI